MSSPQVSADISSERWVVFDVGETLVDETRVWSTWADVCGIPRLTFMAVLGAVIARGGAHQEVFSALGLPHWESRRDELEAAYGGFTEADLYPDVRPSMARMVDAGYRLADLRKPACQSDRRAEGAGPARGAHRDVG